MISTASDVYAGDQSSIGEVNSIQPSTSLSSLVELALLFNNIGVARMDQGDYNNALGQLGHAQGVLRKSCHRVAINAGVSMNEFRNIESTCGDTMQYHSLPALSEGKDNEAPFSPAPMGAPSSSAMDTSTHMERTSAGVSPSKLCKFSSPPCNLFQRSEYDEGMHVLRKGICLKENLSGYHVRMTGLSNIGVSSECMDHALLLLTVTYNLGQVYHALGECDAAFEHYTCALRQSNLYKEQQQILQLHKILDDDTHGTEHEIPTQFAILCNLGYLLYERSQFSEAMAAFTQALSMTEKECGANSWETAVVLNCIGVLHFHMPDPKADESMLCCVRAINILRKLVEKNDTDLSANGSPGTHILKAAIATVLNNIGRVQYLRGSYKEAMKMYQEALVIRKAVLGANSLDVAATVYNTGQTFHQLGALDDAVVCYRDFLRIALATFGESHRDVATMIRRIAQIHHEKGEFDEAVQLYEDALQSATAALGSLHPEIAATLNKLGNIYYEKGEFEKAMNAYQEGLQVERQVLERNHPNIAVTLSNIGQIYKQYGEYERSIRCYKEVLCLQRERLGDCHPSVAVTLSSIGMIYYQLDDYDGALHLFQEALYLRTEALGDEHLDVSATLNSIGMALFKKGRHSMAMEAFTKAYSIRKSILGEVHRDVAIILHNIATIHLQRGDDDMAMKFYQETLRIEKAALGEDHFDVSLTLHHIGQMLQCKGDIESAIFHFQQALAIEEKKFGRCSIKVAKTINGLGNISLQQGRVTEALQQFAEASRIFKKLGQNEDSLAIVGLNLYTISLVHPEASPAA